MEDLRLGKIERQYLKWYPEVVLFPLLGHLASTWHCSSMFCKRQQSGWRNVGRSSNFLYH